MAPGVCGELGPDHKTPCAFDVGHAGPHSWAPEADQWEGDLYAVRTFDIRRPAPADSAPGFVTAHGFCYWPSKLLLNRDGKIGSVAASSPDRARQLEAIALELEALADQLGHQVDDFERDVRELVQLEGGVTSRARG